jgi:hypothetical protein
MEDVKQLTRTGELRVLNEAVIFLQLVEMVEQILSQREALAMGVCSHTTGTFGTGTFSKP